MSLCRGQGGLLKPQFLVVRWAKCNRLTRANGSLDKNGQIQKMEQSTTSLWDSARQRDAGKSIKWFIFEW